MNVLIVSALINFVNNKLIGDDSFFAFNELITKFLGRMTDQKAIEGIDFVIYRNNCLDEHIEQLPKSYEISIRRIVDS